MKAHLRSVRIAPKKANVIAKMVRGMPVHGAMDTLHRTNKKGARMVEQLLRSALANATHNDNQTASQLVVKTIVVNQAQGYRRGVPMSRGRVRPMIKFLSHISVALGVANDTEPAPSKKKEEKPAKKKTATPSQKKKNTVKVSANAKASKGTSSKSTPSSSDSSTSTASAKEDTSSSAS